MTLSHFELQLPKMRMTVPSSFLQKEFEKRADPRNSQQQALIAEMRAHIKKVSTLT